MQQLSLLQLLAAPWGLFIDIKSSLVWEQEVSAPAVIPLHTQGHINTCSYSYCRWAKVPSPKAVHFKAYRRRTGEGLDPDEEGCPLAGFSSLGVWWKISLCVGLQTVCVFVCLWKKKVLVRIQVESFPFISLASLQSTNMLHRLTSDSKLSLFSEWVVCFWVENYFSWHGFDCIYKTIKNWSPSINLLEEATDFYGSESLHLVCTFTKKCCPFALSGQEKQLKKLHYQQ